MKQVYKRDDAEFIAIPTTEPDYYILIHLDSYTSDACRDALYGNKDKGSAEEKNPVCAVSGMLTTSLFDEGCCNWELMPSKGHPFYFNFMNGDFCEHYNDESYQGLYNVKHNLSDYADIRANGDFVSFEMESIPDLAFEPHIWEEFDDRQINWLREKGLVTRHVSVEVSIDMMIKQEESNEDELEESTVTEAAMVTTKDAALRLPSDLPQCSTRLQ